MSTVIDRRAMIDFHSHCLPAMDDGAADVTEATAMLSESLAQGVHTIIATPHFYPDTDKISGEFPGRLSALLESRYYGAVALYTQSSAGDVRPRTSVRNLEDGTPYFARLPFPIVDEFAKSMFQSVCAFLDNGAFQSVEPSLKADAFTMELPIDPVPLSEFEETIIFEKSEVALVRLRVEF